MHELALCSSVVDVVRRQSEMHAFERVTAVRLEVGALSCVAPEALQFCFPAVARGTIAEGAALEVVRVPARAWCLDCAASVEIVERSAPCPSCGGHGLRIVQGEEMRVLDLEVE